VYSLELLISLISHTSKHY